jgi:hypothetical protein
MKVEEIRLGKSALTDNIYAGKLDKAGIGFTQKVDVTGDFIGAAIARWNGFKETLTCSDGKKYEISIKEL